MCMVKLACGKDDDRTVLGRRPETDQPDEAATGGDLLVESRRARAGWGWACCGWAGGVVGLVLPLPGLLEGRYPLKEPEPAEAPKLMRRVKGVLGVVLALPGTKSSSSTADSSMEPALEPALEVVETLSRRTKAAGFVGELPERPMVLTDRRRPRGSVMLGAPGSGGTFPLEGPRWKRLERAAWVMELRRWATPALGALSDMPKGGRCVERCKSVMR